MIIHTKKYKLTHRTYILLGMKNILREQWWVFLIALGILSITFFIHTIWFVIISFVGLILYFLFWFIQFYGVTQLEQNRVMFGRLGYEISSQQIIMAIDPKQGMLAPWDEVKKVIIGKDHFLFIMNKVQLIHLPYRIFNSKSDIKFVETILKRKGLIK